MERGTKRKAAPTSATAVTDSPREAKRQKQPPDPTYSPKPGETTSSVGEIGGRFVAQLKAAKDKNGRLIATNFLTLPSKKQLPQYYEAILLPIAIDTLEEKLARNQYPALTHLESDVKRMVTNAKAFNENSSEVYQDAERIRKMTSNFMVKSNPAYKDPDYVAFPTPLPDVPTVDFAGVTAPKKETPQPDTKPPRRSASAAILAVTTGPEPGDEDYDSDFAGKTYQQAQEMIVKELITFKDNSEYEIFQPFVHLPPRTLKDYYGLIKQPTSLNGVLKKVHGVRGRHETTGTTELRSWDAFENEMKKIWENAREYNEDGSDIYTLAVELEDRFKERLAEAKAKIEELEKKPTIKLNLGAKSQNPLKIRLGTSKPSLSPAPGVNQPTASPAATPGVSVDENALQRQKEMVEAGLNGLKPAASGAQPTPNPAAASPLLAVKGIKNEMQAAQTPVPATATISHSTSMAPPQNNSLGIRPLAPQTNDTVPAAPSASQPHIPFHTPTTGLDNKWRLDGRETLLTNLNITSHPSLLLQRPFTLDLPPSPILTQQSITLNLPPTHTYLRFEPILSTSLIPNPLAPASGLSITRAYKVFVIANGQKINSNHMPGTSRWQFDVKLVQGMNRIEVEVICAGGQRDRGLVPGSGTLMRQGDLELERVSIFANVIRAL